METIDLTQRERNEVVDAKKREFMKKFGSYAATAPLGMYLLMGPGASKAQASGSCLPRCRVDHPNGRGYADCHIRIDGNKVIIDAEHHVPGKNPVQKLYTIENNQVHLKKNGRDRWTKSVDQIKDEHKPSLLYAIFEELGWV